jgi:hypothetical protein
LYVYYVYRNISTATNPLTQKPSAFQLPSAYTQTELYTDNLGLFDEFLSRYSGIYLVTTSNLLYLAKLAVRSYAVESRLAAGSLQAGWIA